MQKNIRIETFEYYVNEDDSSISPYYEMQERLLTLPVGTKVLFMGPKEALFFDVRKDEFASFAVQLGMLDLVYGLNFQSHLIIKPRHEVEEEQEHWNKHIMRALNKPPMPRGVAREVASRDDAIDAITDALGNVFGHKRIKLINLDEIRMQRDTSKEN